MLVQSILSKFKEKVASKLDDIMKKNTVQVEQIEKIKNVVDEN